MQQSLQIDLARRGSQEIDTAHDIGDSLVCIVHHDRKLISERPVSAPQHKVAH